MTIMYNERAWVENDMDGEWRYEKGYYMGEWVWMIKMWNLRYTIPQNWIWA